MTLANRYSCPENTCMTCVVKYISIQGYIILKPGIHEPPSAGKPESSKVGERNNPHAHTSRIRCGCRRKDCGQSGYTWLLAEQGEIPSSCQREKHDPDGGSVELGRASPWRRPPDATVAVGTTQLVHKLSMN